MDITDKHRELVLCGGGGGIAFPHDVVMQSIMGYQQGIITEAEGQRQIKNHAQIVPTISFRNFGNGDLESLLPTLVELHNYIVQVVARFAAELPCIP
jgi:hypothetical protein